MHCPRCGNRLSESQHGECLACGTRLPQVWATALDPHKREPMAVDLVVELFGRYTAEQITQSWSDEPRPSTRRIEEAIAATWAQEEMLAARYGRTLYNDELGRLLRADLTPSSLHLHLGLTCYRDFVGTNLNNAELVMSEHPDALANPLGTSVTVVTSDNLLAFGRRSQRVAYHGRHLHALGGMLEQLDRLANGGYDLFAAASRELHEELNVRGDEIAEMVIVGLVRDLSILQPELLFEAALSLTSKELEERFPSAPEHEEHSRIEFVRGEPAAIASFLMEAEPVTAVAKGALVLYGRSRWGEAWYEQTCDRVFGSVPFATVLDSRKDQTGTG